MEGSWKDKRLSSSQTLFICPIMYEKSLSVDRPSRMDGVTFVSLFLGRTLHPFTNIENSLNLSLSRNPRPFTVQWLYIWPVKETRWRYSFTKYECDNVHLRSCKDTISMTLYKESVFFDSGFFITLNGFQGGQYSPSESGVNVP